MRINKGVELMLRPKNKKGEDLKNRIHFEKMFSLFNREFHFNISFSIKNKQSLGGEKWN